MTSIRWQRKTGRRLGLITGLLGALLVLPAAAQAHGGDRHHDRDHRRHVVKRHHAPRGHEVHPGVLRSRCRADRLHARAWRHERRAHRRAHRQGRFAFQRGHRACFHGRYGLYCR